MVCPNATCRHVDGMHDECGCTVIGCACPRAFGFDAQFDVDPDNVSDNAIAVSAVALAAHSVHVSQIGHRP